MGAGHRRNASLLFIAGALLLIGFALCAYQLNDSELVGVTNDEGWTYQFIRQTYPGIIERTFFWNEPHPVGSYFLYKAWEQFAGESAFAIRFLSTAFGVLAIALIWRLCGELRLNRWSGVVPVTASALMAFSPIMVAHSREMRMYAVLVALTLASSVLMLVMLRKPSWGVALGYMGEFRAAINYPDLSFDFYYKRPYIILPPREGDEASAIEIARRLKADGVRRVALQLVGPSYWDDRNIATTALAQEFSQIEEVFTGKWIVRVFGRREPDELQPIGTAFDNGVRLASALVLPSPAASLVEVNTHWSGSVDALTGSEKLFMHIYGPDNALVAQLDLLFTTNMLVKPVNTHGIRLPENLLPGAYRIAIGLYDPARPGAPRLLTGDGRDSVELAQFIVPGE